MQLFEIFVTIGLIHDDPAADQIELGHSRFNLKTRLWVLSSILQFFFFFSILKSSRARNCMKIGVKKTSTTTPKETINIQIRLAMVQAVRRTDIYDSSKKVNNETKRHKSRDR